MTLFDKTLLLVRYLVRKLFPNSRVALLLTNPVLYVLGFINYLRQDCPELEKIVYVSPARF